MCLIWSMSPFSAKGISKFFCVPTSIFQTRGFLSSEFSIPTAWKVKSMFPQAEGYKIKITVKCTSIYFHLTYGSFSPCKISSKKFWGSRRMKCCILCSKLYHSNLIFCLIESKYLINICYVAGLLTIKVRHDFANVYNYMNLRNWPNWFRNKLLMNLEKMTQANYNLS